MSYFRGSWLLAALGPAMEKYIVSRLFDVRRSPPSPPSIAARQPPALPTIRWVWIRRFWATLCIPPSERGTTRGAGRRVPAGLPRPPPPAPRARCVMPLPIAAAVLVCECRQPRAHDAAAAWRPGGGGGGGAVSGCPPLQLSAVQVGAGVQQELIELLVSATDATQPAISALVADLSRRYARYRQGSPPPEAPGSRHSFAMIESPTRASGSPEGASCARTAAAAVLSAAAAPQGCSTRSRQSRWPGRRGRSRGTLWSRSFPSGLPNSCRRPAAAAGKPRSAARPPHSTAAATRRPCRFPPAARRPCPLSPPLPARLPLTATASWRNPTRLPSRRGEPPPREGGLRAA